MAKHINKGWAKSLENAAQPIGIVLGGNLQPDSRKITHGKSLPGPGYRLLLPGEPSVHGIDTSPVLVISPVPIRASEPSPTPAPTTSPSKRGAADQAPFRRRK